MLAYSQFWGLKCPILMKGDTRRALEYVEWRSGNRVVRLQHDSVISVLVLSK